MSKAGLDLPKGIQERGYEVRTFMPKYGCINERRNQLHEVIRLSGMNLIIDDTDHPLIIKVATLQPARMQVYFIYNEDYFQRNPGKGLETEESPELNDERCIFFVRGTIETVKKLRWEASIVHCQGWLSALTPLYVKKVYADDPSFRGSKVVYSLYGSSFNGQLDPRFEEKLRMEGFSDDDLINRRTSCRLHRSCKTGARPLRRRDYPHRDRRPGIARLHRREQDSMSSLRRQFRRGQICRILQDIIKSTIRNA